jgi:hypothetical protein
MGQQAESVFDGLAFRLGTNSGLAAAIRKRELSDIGHQVEEAAPQPWPSRPASGNIMNKVS